MGSRSRKFRSFWTPRSALLLAAFLLLVAAPAAASPEEELARGRTWLLGQQNPDGSFGTGSDLLPRDSATVLQALGGGAADPAIARGIAYLNATGDRAAYFRALRIQALADAGEPVESLLDSLNDFRNGAGMGAFGSYFSNLFDTTLTVEAYARDERDRALQIVPLLDYLIASQGSDGGWGFLPGTPSQVFYTAETLWALVRLNALDVAPTVIDRARVYLIAQKKPDGTFGSVVETAVAYRALTAAGYRFPAGQPDPVAALLAAQAADGSWEADAYTTAEVMRALSTHAPNLVIGSMTASATVVTAGTPVAVLVTITNAGPLAAGASRLALRAGTVDGAQRAEAAIPALDPGASHSATLQVDTSGDQGELVLHAVADADGAVAELDEHDNTASLRIVLRALPDLAIFPAQITVSPARPQPNTAFQVRAVAQNLGEQSVTQLGYRISRVAAGVPVQVLGQGTAGPIAPGGSLLLTAPANLPEGEHTVLVELDPASAIEESLEEDNTATMTFFVVDDTLPDFTIAAAELLATPNEPAPGATVSFNVTVRNKGQQAGTAVVEVFDGDPATGGAVVATQSVTLGVNASKVITGTFTAQATTFVVTAAADRAQQLIESDESNNRAQRTLRQLPDLAVGYDGIAFTPAAPLAGEAVSVAVTVRNGGTSAAPATVVGLFSGDPESGGVEVARAPVEAIPAGGNRTVQLAWTAAGGVNDLVVVADLEEEALEISEANNRTARELHVPRATGPNLVVDAIDRSGLTHSALDLSIGGTAGVTVANTGTAAVTASFLVRLFEDLDGDQLFGAEDREVGSVVVNDDIATGSTLAVSVPAAGSLSFSHSLVVVHVDAADTVAETREDDNRRLLFADCEAPAPAPSFTPVEKWWVPEIEVQNAPVVVQLSDDNGDGAIDSRDNPDVVFHTADAQGTMVLAVSGLDGSRLWAFRSTPSNPLQHEKVHVSAADLDGDGVAEIIAVQNNSRLVALDRTGAVRWVSDPIERTGGDWRGGSAVGDLTGDGVPEIVVGRAVLSNTGKLLGVGTANAGRNDNYYGPLGIGYLYDQQHSIIADVDLDGRAEVVAGDTVYRLVNGVLTVVWDHREHDNMLEDGFSAVANLDGDPYPEIVYVSAGFVKILNHDGSTRTPYRRLVTPAWPINENSMVTFWGGPPTVADLTGDGVPEILVAADTELIAYNANLGTLWRKPTFDFAAMTSATAFDLDGNGKREVIYADENNLYILDGATGATLHQRKNNSLTGTELPVVADIDNDGRADILVPSSHDRRWDRSTIGMHALSHPSWVGTRPIWNQHSYHVTNIQLDGTVPRAETPSWQLTNTFRANLQMPRRPLRLPNLTVGLPRVKAATAQGIPVVLRVGNGGSGWAPAGVEVALYAAGDPTAVGTAKTTAALAPGGWVDLTIHWQGALDEPLAATATVDPQELVEQCDRADDQVAFEIAEPLLPDLAIPPTGVAFTGTPTAGQMLPTTVQVRNDGRAAAPATILRVFDGSNTGARILAETAVPALAPAESTVLGINVDTLGLAAGLHSLRIVADPLDVIPEVEDANNAAVLQITLNAATRPDLHATLLTVQPTTVTAGQPALLRAEILNRGLALDGGFEISFRINRAEVARVDHPAALATGERVVVDDELATHGRKGTLLVEAVADPQNQVTEGSEANNAAASSLTVLGSPLTVSASTDKPRYRAADSVQVTVSGFNAGQQAEAATLFVVIQDASGTEVARLAEQAVALPAGASSFAFSWPASRLLPAPYAVVARLERTGAVIAQGFAGFSVSADLKVEAELFTDRSGYAPNGTVLLHGGVRNTSAATLVENATATVLVLDPAGGEALRRQIPLAQVLPGAFVAVSATWDVGTAAPGAWRAELRVTNTYGELLATASSPFEIEDSSQTGAGLQGFLTLAPRVQGAGGPVAASYRIDNRGNAAVNDLVVHLEVLDFASGETVARLDEPRPVAKGASVDGVWRIDTASLAPGNYLVSLASVIGTQSKRLASEPLSVLPGLLVEDLEVREGDSGTTTASVTVRLLPASDQPVTVDYATTDGSAEAGTDYVAASGTLTFAPGETVKTVAVTLRGDVDEELHETFLVNLTAAMAAAIADAQAVVTIEDEEGCASTNLIVNPGGEEGAAGSALPGWNTAGVGAWRFDFADPPSFEGHSYFASSAAAEIYQDVPLAPFAALIDAGTLELVFEGFGWSPGGARALVEYRDESGAVLDTVDTGELPAADTWQAFVGRRAAPPGTRAARVRLLAGTIGKTGFDRLALRSLGVVTLGADPLSVAEGAGAAGLVLELSCASPSPVTMSYATADLEAVAGQDYQATTGSATVAAGELTAPVAVPLLADTLDENDERFALNVSSSDVIVLTGQVLVTILDDDGTVTVSAAPAAVSEGDAGTVEAVFALTLSAPSGREVRVDYSTKAGSAAAGADFQALSGTAVFTPGQTEREVRVAVVGDAIDELVETFQLTLAKPVNAVLATPGASATVVDDDTAQVAAADAEVVEGDAGNAGTAKVAVTLSVASDRPVRVDFSTVPGTAATPQDFGSVSGTLTFPPGTRQLLVSVPIVGEDLEETTESFLVQLAGVVDAEMADPEATVTLIDDDGPVLSIDDVSLLEGNSGTREALFTVRSVPASTRTVTVDVVTADREATAGQDYTPVSASLTFAPGETVKTVAVTVLSEKVEEPDETFVVRLEHPVNAAVSRSEGIGRILDDDVFYISLHDLYLVESKPAATLKLRLNRASEDEIRVDVATADDVATANADYVATTQTVIFPPGSTEQQVPVALLDDTIHEGPERFWADLSGAVGAHLTRTRAGVHLLDDEKPASYQLLTTVRDFKPGHPDIHNCNSVPRPATVLGTNGKMVHASGGSGAATFEQWFRDTTGVNLSTGYDAPFTKNGTQYEHWRTSDFFPIDGQLYGNEGGHNYQFTAEVHAWFQYETGATFLYGSDDDGWCYINNRLAIDLAGCHGPTSRTVTLSSLAASHGLIVGESYRLDCFMAERGQGVSGFYFQTPLYLQQFEPGTLQLDPLAATVAEGAQPAFKVKRVGGAFGTATATATATGGTATAPDDFDPISLPLVFGHGNRQDRSLSLRVVNDTLEEGDETLELGLVDVTPQQAQSAFSRAAVTIVDDEAFPIPTLLTSIVSEGSRGEEDVVVEITLLGENRHGVSLTYATADGTALVGSDYRAASGTIQLNAGQQQKHLLIRVIGDAQIEEDEWLDLVLSGTGFRGGSARLRLTLADDDRCPTPNLVRNGDFEQTVAGGTGIPGVVPGWTTLQGQWKSWSGNYGGGLYNVLVHQAPLGELIQEIDLTGFEQFVDRGHQRFGFRVMQASWNAENPPDTGRVIVELLDGARQVLATFDTGEIAVTTGFGMVSTVMTAPPGTRLARVHLISKRYVSADANSHFDGTVLVGLNVPSLAVDDATFTEGQAGTSLVSLPVRLACTTDRPVTVDFSTQDGTAKAGEDYQNAIGTLVIPPGQITGAIPLTLLGDTITEGNQTFTVHLQNPTAAVVPDGELTVTITDDETQLSIANASKNEGNQGSSLLELTVTLSKTSTLPVTVDYATVDYSALAGEDYIATSGTLTFAPGETQKKIAVEILGDTQVEPDEEFFVDLTNANNAGVTQARATGKIKQDDVEITVADAQVAEGNSGTRKAIFDLALSSASGQTVTVNYRTSDLLATAGADYQARTGTVSFSAGETKRTVEITVNGDTAIEGSETFILTLENPQNAFVVVNEATGFIIDDDDCPSVNLLANGGAEAALVGGEIPSWREVVGTVWSTRTSSPSPIEGASYFAAGTVDAGELAQDVDVSPFAEWIDDDLQRFSFEGWIYSSNLAPPDTTRVIVEYRDAANANVIASWSSGEEASLDTWRYISDLRLAPAGTRWIRVRLVATRKRPSGFNFAFFDGLSLRSLGTPVVLLSDPEVVEGDEQNVMLPYELKLSCATQREVTLSYATADGTAKAPGDYVATTGTFTYQPGETAKTATIELIGDFSNEIRESFRIEIADAVNTVVLDRSGEITLRDADPGTPPVQGSTHIYTLDADFDLGQAAGVNHDAPNNDQLQINAQGGSFPYLWVAASGKGTIVKIDTVTGVVLGEYSTNPDNRGNSDPSRTTVALDGSVWVGNRGDASVTHVGLPELGQCIDRNGNGFIETSSGYQDVRSWPNASGQNTNGGVSTAADECILHYIKMRQGIPRHVSVDRDGNIWVGGYQGSCSSCFDLLDGQTGATLRQVNFSCGGYGGLVDANGILWSSGLGPVLRWDPTQPTSTARCLGTSDAYGLAIARDGSIFANQHGSDRIWKISPDGNTITSFPRGAGCGQGLAIDANDQIWSSSSRHCTGTQIAHRKTDGSLVGILNGVPTGSTGIAVDAEGKIWAAADQASVAFRIDPSQGPLGPDGVTRVGAVDLVVNLPGANPYNYSDMTGFVALRSTARQGSWSVIQDAGIPGAEWGVVSWNTEPQASLPPGSSVVVEVRTANTVPALGPTTWLAVQSGQRFQRFGRYLQVRVTLKRGTATVSPVLSDLRIGIQEPDITVNDVRLTEGDSGTTDAVFTVRLNEPVGHTVTVAWETQGGTATAGADYTATSGTLTIPAGATTGTLTVPVLGDTVYEEDETFSVRLLSALGGRLVDDTGEGVIEDDDGALVTASKADTLLEDRDDNGVVTPGDVVGYTVTVTSLATSPLTGLIFEDPVPAHSAIVAGSVTTTSGAIQSESPVRVALGELPAGGTATVSFAVTLEVPWPAGVEQLVNQGQVTGVPSGAVLTDDPDLPGTEDPTVTTLAAVPVLAADKRDRLLEDRDNDTHPSPGDVLRYTVEVRNTGTVAASGVVFQDVAPPYTSFVPGSVVASEGVIESDDPVRVRLDSLAANATASITFSVLVDSPVPPTVDEISNQGTVTSDDRPAVLTDDPDVPGRQPTVTTLVAEPRLAAAKVDELATDADGDEVPSPGDVIEYTVTVVNNGNTSATALAILDQIPQHTTLVAGSVTASRGAVVAESPVQVELDELPAGEEITVTFRVRIVNPVEPWVVEVSNQARVWSAEVDELLSDDPDLTGDANPTLTPISASPVLAVAKTDVLFADGNGDGFASPGEVVLYQITVTNAGNTAATEVRLTDDIPPLTTLEPGTVQTSQGTVTSESPVDVALGTIPAGGTATVSFRVRIDDPFPETASEISNQATVTATELAAVPSDDPKTSAPRDATVTPVVLPIEISVADVTVNEAAGTAVFQVALSRAGIRDVSIEIAMSDGTAGAPGDYTASSGTLTVPSGQTTAQIAVTVVDDTLDEPDETFTLTLSEPAGAVLADAEAVGTILDDDQPPVLTVANVTVTEGNAGTTEATFTLVLSGPSSFPIGVGYATAPETATTGAAFSSDFTMASGSVAFAPGEVTRQVTIAVLGDLVDEDDETFRLLLTDPVFVTLAQTQAIGTILDDDQPPALAIADITVQESDAGTILATFAVTLSAPSGREVRADYTTADVEALAGIDYQAAAGLLVLPAGTTAGTLTVPVLGDLVDEADERFELRLANPLNAALADPVGVGTILDDDELPALSIGDVTIHEGDGSALRDVEVPLTLSAPSASVVTVSFAGADGTATAPQDYIVAADTVMIPAGSTGGVVRLKVRSDLVDELDETFQILLSDPTNATLADTEGLVTIVDDDEALASVSDVAVTEGHSGTTGAVFTIRLSTTSDREVRMDYATADGTATDPADYRGTAGTLTFPAGEQERTVTVQVVGDLLLENLEETFRLELSNPVDTAFADPVGVGTILDDEACAGPNLLVNGDAEARPVNGSPAGWREIAGTDWRRVYRATAPPAFQGQGYLAPGSFTPSGSVTAAELSQTVSLMPFAALIDGADQRFLFRGAVRTGPGSADTARVVVEYLDAAGAVLDAFDSGALSAASGWMELTDDHLVPAGTRAVRVRLIAAWGEGNTLEAWFDALSLQPQRTAVITVDDLVETEGDSGQHDGRFVLRLSCPVSQPVEVAFSTADGKARAGADYLATSGTAVLPAGATAQPVPVPILGDILYEGHEPFTLDLALPLEGGAVLLDAQGSGLILDDDYCARSPGYWKTHRQNWPVDFLMLGGIEVEANTLAAILDDEGSDASRHLARQLIATKFNLLVGSDPVIVPTVEAADAFLALHPVGSNPQGAARDEANRIKDILDPYNTTKIAGCTEAAPIH